MLLSLLLMLGGLGLRGYANLRQPSPAESSPATGGGLPTPPGARSFVPDDLAADTPTAQPAPQPTAIDLWSPTLFGVGFGFFAGFCIAYAVRSLLKLAVVGIGVLLLAALGLQYAGLIQLDWATVSQRYDTFMTWLAPRAQGFWRFVTTQLPSAGSAIVGAFVGFRRGN